MDTNKTKNVDALLQSALKSTDAPDIALIRSVKHELQKKEEAQLNKPRFTRPLKRVAAVIAATLALSTTALAAGAYLGGFDRLREIVGTERAAVLHPVEIVSEPDANGEQFANVNSTENNNGEALACDGTILNTVNNLAEQGIRAELVAVGVFDNVVDVYITLEDLISNRFDGNFQVSHTTLPIGQSHIGNLSQAPEIIHRTDCGIVTLRTREIFTESVAGMELMYNLLGITYDMEYTYHRPNLHNLDIDFTSATTQPHAIFSPGMSIPWAGGGPGLESQAYFDLVNQQLEADGFPVLQPHLHDIEIDIDGESFVVSSIGIIENRLHVQIYLPNTGAMPSFMLYAYPDADVTTMSFGFSTDPYGSPIVAGAWHDCPAPIRYLEMILFDVDTDNLAIYKMRGALEAANSGNTLDVEWSTAFEVDINDTKLIASNLAVEYGFATITEVRVTPFLIQMLLDTEAAAGTNPPEILVHTTAGIVRPSQAMTFGGGDSNMGTFIFDMGDNPLALDTVVSVEIDGIEVLLR